MESAQGSERNLYSLLKVDRDATEEEIHRAYKALSATFHPDKLPPTTSAETREQIQQFFLEFKRAST
jgi:DnaJ-class molecular chaperone